MGLGERVALIRQAPLLTSPGTSWHYSSPGYLLVGHIVAQASGQPYPDFLTGQVLVQLGLTETSTGSDQAPAYAARGYRDGQPVTPWPLSGEAGHPWPRPCRGWRARRHARYPRCPRDP